MEVVGAVASILTFIQVADRVINLCKSYLELAHDAPSDLRAILIETSTLQTILDNLQFLVSCGHSPTALHILAGEEGPIAGCLKAIKEIEGLFPSGYASSRRPKSSSKRQKVKATLTALAWPFKENKAKQLLGELAQYKTTINLALSTESLRDAKDIKSKTNEIHTTLSELQRHEVYKWLRSTNPSSLHHQASEKYEPGTGDWVLRSDEWKAWFTGDSRSLWIYGIPGAGKTVLASHLIEHVKTVQKKEKSRKIGYVYYYCYFGHNQNEAIPFLKWTVSQLCCNAEFVPPLLYELYKDGSEPSLADLLMVLEAIVQVYDRINIILDAIDESMPRYDLLRVLRDLATDSRFRNVSILATSRQYIDIEEVMLKISAPVSMSNPLLDADIKLYVASQLRAHPRMSGWPADIQQEVLKALSAKAQGMFRWVVCQLDILQHLKPDRNIVTNALANLPKTLDETYERIFLDIPEYSRIFVHHALKLIYSHRALCGRNISCSILLQAAQRTSPELALFGNKYDYGEELLRKFCGCLITVIPEAMADRLALFFGDETTPTVSFAHYTVWEFLDSIRIHNGPAAFFAVDAGLANMEFARMLMLDAVNLETYRLLDWDSLRSGFLEGCGTLDDNFSLYCILCSIFSLRAWGTEICQRDDLRILAFGLLDPSKPHFKELKYAANLIASKNCLYAGWSNGYEFWELCWRAEPDLSEVKTLINLLYVDGSCELGKKFLENHDIKDVMRTQLDLGYPDMEEPFQFTKVRFEGSVREFCERYSKGPFAPIQVRLFLEDVAERDLDH